MINALTLTLGVTSVFAFASGDPYWVDYSTKCNLQSCDSVTPLDFSTDFSSPNAYVMYQTSQGNGDRLAKYQQSFSSKAYGKKRIVLDPEQTYQEIVGFGGALTDSAALTIAQLNSTELQDLLLSNYYATSGIEYSLARVPIASCDFSLGVYSYNDAEDDYALENFSIDVDRTDYTGNKLSFIQRVLAMTREACKDPLASHTTPLKLFASPWAPPAWMTQTNSTVDNPRLRDEPQVYQAWALYFSKFFSAYHDEGIDFWGVTTQNEPNGNTGAWQDLKYSATEMLNFVKGYLGPQLRETHPALKLMVLDDQRTHLPEWTQTIFADEGASKFIDGIGLHWYADVEDYLAFITKPFEKMRAVHEQYPDKFLLATEACAGFIPIIDQGPKLGNWQRAERYGYDILHDLNAFAVGWTDWNIALDMSGGPNWAENVVDAPILVDTADKGTFYKNPMFYFLGHFSKFLTPGSRRIEAASTAPGKQKAMEVTSFVTPDGLSIVAVVMNREESEQAFSLSVKDDQRGFINVNMPANSIQTFIFKK